MKRGVFVVAVALALVAIVGGGTAIAQDITIVNMPFKFTAGSKVMDPGRYEVRMNEDRTTIMLTPERGAGDIVPTITRLAIQQPMQNGKLVFDKVGEQYYLSEVWFPSEDGFLVRDTKQPHQHHIITGEKKKPS